MRDAAGKLTDRFHLLRLPQLRFQTALLGHVPENAEHADGSAAVVAHGRLDDAHRPLLALDERLLFGLQTLAVQQHLAVVGANFSARAAG